MDKRLFRYLLLTASLAFAGTAHARVSLADLQNQINDLRAQINALEPDLAGPAGGSSGIISSAFASGSGTSPSGTDIMFIAEPAIVDVGLGQKVHVTSSKSLGSNTYDDAKGLNLWICYRVEGDIGLPTTVGSGVYGQEVRKDTRVVYGLSAIVTDLDGVYEVGLCADANNNDGWNSNEWSYTTALVYADLELPAIIEGPPVR